MNWDEKAEDYAGAHHTYEHLGYGENMRFHKKFVAGAKWQRDQLRTDEAVERAARAVFDGEYSGAWDAVAEWMREDCRIAARAAITALIGEEP